MDALATEFKRWELELITTEELLVAISNNVPEASLRREAMEHVFAMDAEYMPYFCE